MWCLKNGATGTEMGCWCCLQNMRIGRGQRVNGPAVRRFDGSKTRLQG
jgi:hypothetical protein